jgi:hypothetical protein
MTRPRILRLFRIAASAVFGILCLLLVALWVRSCSHIESTSVRIAGERIAGATSVKQHIIVAISRYHPILGVPHRWSLNSRSIADTFPGKSDSQIERQIGFPEFPGFSFRRNGSGGFRLVIPHWFLVSVTVFLAIAPWIRYSKRFSLRTLLLATTLVAVVLGLIMAM